MNDKSVPHVANLHEDPLMSGVVYYSLLKGEIHIGRKTGKPVPEIILGAIGIKPNHACIKLQKNGLFEFSVCDAEAAATTMVNGKPLNPKKRSRILNHLDRLAFSGGFIYVFRYPKLRRLIEAKVQENAAKNEGIDLEVQTAQAWELIQENGMEGIEVDTPTKESLGVHEYSELEIQEDEKCTDWDMAFKEVEDGENAKQQKIIKERELKLKKDKQAMEKAMEAQKAEQEKKVKEAQ